jgi:hypothetical protein
MAPLENRSAVYSQYVSTESAAGACSQPGMGRFSVQP